MMTNEETIEVLDDMKIKIAIPKSAITQRKRNEALDKAIKALGQQPKSGEWIITGYDYKCTNCDAEINGEINYMSKSKIKYCPYCGIMLEREGSGTIDNNSAE